MTAVILRLSASADFQVRSNIAIRRHQALVNCAFSFCWVALVCPSAAVTRHAASAGRRRRREGISPAGQPQPPPCWPGDPGAARLASPADRATALVAGMVQGAPAQAAPGPDDIPRGGPRPAPLHPELANHPIRLPGRPPPRQGAGPGAQPRLGQSGALLFAPKAGSSPLDVGEMQDLGFVKRRSTMSNTFRAGSPSRRRR
jgi:hypothetical protein